MIRVLIQGQQSEISRQQKSRELLDQRLESFEARIEKLTAEVFFKIDDQHTQLKEIGDVCIGANA